MMMEVDHGGGDGEGGVVGGNGGHGGDSFLLCLLLLFVFVFNLMCTLVFLRFYNHFIKQRKSWFP